jgi:hypothetical protein
MRLRVALLALFFAAAFAAPARAEGTALPPDAARGLDQIYGGDPDAAISTAHTIEQAEPENPVGYLLEGEAEWWKIYCSACDVKWGQFDAWKHPKKSEDGAYFRQADNVIALSDKAIALARAQLAKSNTAEMHVYAGLGYALKARLYGLLDERRNIARAAVAARAEFLAALQLDPDTPDATAGLGIYNYYVDALSAFAKVLRFFMGIPGGSRQEGIRQMKAGIEGGGFLAVDTRFYLARNLRTFDQRYTDALSAAEPLAARYPRNPIFQLLAGNLNVELGRNAKASEYFHAVFASPDSDPDPVCAARTRAVANSFLATIH